MTSTVTKQLSDLEIAKIEAFCADKEMFEAVKKVILAGIYSHGTIQENYVHNPLVNAAFSLVSLSSENPIPDEIVGQHLKSVWSGIRAMKIAFDELESIKNKQESVPSDYNEAM